MKNIKLNLLIISLLVITFACQQQTYTNTSSASTTSATTVKVDKFVPDFQLNRFENEIKGLEKSDSTLGTPQGQIIFYGSSSFKYWTTVQSDLENNQILNHGFGGSTFPELTYFADRMVMPYKPKTLVLYCENDMFSAKPKTADQTFEDYKELVEKVRDKLPNVRVFTLSLKPSPSRKSKWADVEKVNTSIKNYSKRMPNMYYVDITNVMYDTTGSVNGRLFRADSLHMNPEGYKLWAEILKPILK